MAFIGVGAARMRSCQAAVKHDTAPRHEPDGVEEVSGRNRRRRERVGKVGGHTFCLVQSTVSPQYWVVYCGIYYVWGKPKGDIVHVIFTLPSAGKNGENILI